MLINAVNVNTVKKMNVTYTQHALTRMAERGVSQAEVEATLAAPVNTGYEVADSIPINKDLVMGDIMNAAEKNNPALLVAKYPI